MNRVCRFCHRRRWLALLAAALLAGRVWGGEAAPERAELRVVTSGGFAAAHDALRGQAEAALGLRLHTEYGSSSGGAPDSIPARLARGERFDCVILSRPALEGLREAGYIAADSRTDLARSRIGMAVKKGAATPDIGSVAAFLRTLSAARSIGYSASASGTYLATVLFPRLGIWAQLEPKSRRILSERVAAVVARGEVELGFQQISEILPVAGATYAGPIPESLQKITTFSAAIPAAAANREGARRFIDYLASPRRAAPIAASGLMPVAGR